YGRQANSVVISRLSGFTLAALPASFTRSCTVVHFLAQLVGGFARINPAYAISMDNGKILNLGKF
ncbi:hypothetical protein, partial [Enterovibrio norvegicus]|uniref:hypothetical protein n=1 Tax=Enterovibrio norvegicus TaxID=188144 RepID=UPI001A7E1779